MAYNKTTWVDFETKLTAANLNKIENGLEATANVADGTAQTVESWGGTNGPVTRIPTIETAVSTHNTRLNTIELDLYAENDGIEDRLAVAEGDIDDLETEVATIKQSHGSTLSTIESVLSGHLGDKSNPHKVTPAQLGVYTATEVDDLLTAGTGTVILDEESNYDTVVLSDVYPNKQRIIIQATKTTADADDYYSGGPNSLWTLSESSSTTLTINAAADMGQFSNVLSNNSYEIIYETMDGLNVAHHTAIPSDSEFFPSMRYIYPAYITPNNGWALNYSSDGAYDTFVTIILYSQSQRRFFLVPTGRNGSTYEHLAFCIKDNRYLLVKGNYVYKYTFDLQRYGNDLKLYALGFTYGYYDLSSSSTTIALKSVSAECAHFLLDDTSGSAILPYTYTPVANYEYAFELATNSTSVVFTAYNYLQPYSLELTMQYAKGGGELINVGKNIPVNQEKLDKELDIKIKRALFDLISTGTGDPDASTPGRLYFKYLE